MDQENLIMWTCRSCRATTYRIYSASVEKLPTILYFQCVGCGMTGKMDVTTFTALGKMDFKQNNTPSEIVSADTIEKPQSKAQEVPKT